jgi:YHS domain-containing protein
MIEQQLSRTGSRFRSISAVSPNHGPGRTLAISLVVALATLLCSVPGVRAEGTPHYVPSDDPYLPRVEYGDGLVSINKRCTVRKVLMTTTTRPVYINGRPLGFCCPVCSWTWVTMPWKFLNEEKISVNGAVNKYKPAVIDSLHLSWVNWEVYFFTDMDAKARFDKDPLKYCGKLTDPVTGKRFQPHFWSPKTVYRGRVYYFSSGKTKDEYLDNPRAYTFRRMN